MYKEWRKAIFQKKNRLKKYMMGPNINKLGQLKSYEKL